jgi:hypothetical protein
MSHMCLYGIKRSSLLVILFRLSGVGGYTYTRTHRQQGYFISLLQFFSRSRLKRWATHLIICACYSWEITLNLGLEGSYDNMWDWKEIREITGEDNTITVGNNETSMGMTLGHLNYVTRNLSGSIRVWCNEFELIGLLASRYNQQLTVWPL